MKTHINHKGSETEKSRPLSLSSEAGVTLIELLVTIVILGVIMAPMVEGYVFAWQTSLDAQRRSKAVMLANWKIEELRTTKGYSGLSDVDSISRTDCTLPDPYGSTSGDVKYECSVTVEAVDGLDPNFAAEKVSLKIYYPSIIKGGETRTVNCGTDDGSCTASDYATYVSKLSK